VVTVDELVVGDEPGAWEALEFAVEGDVCILGDVRIRLAGTGAGKGLNGWSLRGVDAQEFDGLPTATSERAPPDGALAHPNGVIAIDHVVAITPDLDRTISALQAVGLDLRRVREAPTPAGAPRQAFFRLGAVILEVVQEPPEAIERGGGARRPAFFWGFALLSADLEATVASLGDRVSEIRPAVQPGRRIGPPAPLSRPLGPGGADDATAPELIVRLPGS